MRGWKRLGGLAAAAMLFVAACGGDDTAAEENGTEAATDNGGTETTNEAGDEGMRQACADLEGPLADPVTLQVADAQLSASAGIYVAMDLGFFDDEGIEIELTQLPSGTDQITVLASGQLDIGVLGPATGVFNSIIQGVETRFIASQVVITEEDASFGTLVKQELIDSGEYTGPADLEGLRIAIGAGSIQQEYYLSRLLAQGDLTLDDIEVVEFQFPDMVAALANDRVDAIQAPEPLLANAEFQELGTLQHPLGQYWTGGATFSATSADLADNSPEVVTRFVRALLRAFRAYDDALYGSGQGLDEVFAALEAHTQTFVDDQYGLLQQRGGNPHVDVNGEIDVDALDEIQQYQLEDGGLERLLEPDEYIDRTFLDQALQCLDEEGAE